MPPPSDLNPSGELLVSALEAVIGRWRARLAVGGYNKPLDLSLRMFLLILSEIPSNRRFVVAC